jgi:hypothetical protein
MSEQTLPGGVDDVRAWSHDLQLRRWWIVEGLRVFLLVAGLALAAATIEVVALVGQLQGAGSAAANALGLGGTDVAQLLVTQWSLTYFGAHFVPVELGLSGPGVASLALSSLPAGTAAAIGQSTVLSGLGSLTLTAVVVWLGFRVGGRLERQAPYRGPAIMSALRAGLVAVPYGLASLVLFFAGHWQLSVVGQVLVNAAPAPVALVTPFMVLGLAAGAGAVWARPARTRVEAAILRGACLGLLGLAAGIVTTVALAIVAGVLWLIGTQASQAGQQAPATPAPPSTSQPEVTWGGFLLVVLVLLLIGLYVLNVVAGLWAADVGFWLLNLGPLAVIVLAGPVVGALMGAVFLRPLTDFLEHAAFVAAFAGGSFVLAAASQVNLFRSTVGASPGVVLLISGMLAAAAAAVGASLSRTATGRALAVWGPLAGRVAQLDARMSRVVEPVRRPKATLVSTGIRCASCGDGLAAEDSFCSRCGVAVPIVPRCASCGREAAAADVFCAGCGARVQPLPASAGCGRELPPDGAFCPACGARADLGTGRP